VNLRDRTLLLALLPAASGCAGNASAAATASPTPAAHVDVVTVQHGTITPTLEIAGVIVPYRQIGVSANLAEPISEVDVQEGDRVRAGQQLARLQTDDLQAQLASSERVVAEDEARYNQTAYQVSAVSAQDQSAVRSAQATLRQAEVNLAGAQVDLRRYQGLESQGYLAPQTVDEQRTTVASDQSAVTSARAALAQAIANAQANGRGVDAGEQQQELQAAQAAVDAARASVMQLQRQIARAVVVAPVDGIIAAVNANPGEYPSGRQLFTLEQSSTVYAVLPSSTMQAVQIRSGASATVTPNGSTTHDRGRVVAVLDQIQPGTTNFTVKVLLDNADGHLRGGMPVTAIVSLPSVSGAKIPVTAFVDDTHSAVYGVSNGVVRQVSVHEIKDDGNNAIVSGISDGSQVVRNVESAAVAGGDHVAVAASH
jgi:multidrug efflux pump subunit AcrA (membrane-fusion protein)